MKHHIHKFMKSTCKWYYYIVMKCRFHENSFDSKNGELIIRIYKYPAKLYHFFHMYFKYCFKSFKWIELCRSKCVRTFVQLKKTENCKAFHLKLFGFWCKLYASARLIERFVVWLSLNLVVQRKENGDVLNSRFFAQ